VRTTGRTVGPGAWAIVAPRGLRIAGPTGRSNPTEAGSSEPAAGAATQTEPPGTGPSGPKPPDQPFGGGPAAHLRRSLTGVTPSGAAPDGGVHGTRPRPLLRKRPRTWTTDHGQSHRFGGDGGRGPRAAAKAASSEAAKDADHGAQPRGNLFGGGQREVHHGAQPKPPFRGRPRRCTTDTPKRGVINRRRAWEARQRRQPWARPARRLGATNEQTRLTQEPRGGEERQEGNGRREKNSYEEGKSSEGCNPRGATGMKQGRKGPGRSARHEAVKNRPRRQPEAGNLGVTSCPGSNASKGQKPQERCLEAAASKRSPLVYTPKGGQGQKRMVPSLLRIRDRGRQGTTSQSGQAWLRTKRERSTNTALPRRFSKL
jgi:hypothetical protein